MSRLKLPLIALFAAIASMPSWAQNTNPPPSPAQQPAAGSNGGIGTATVKPTHLPPSQRNPLLTDSGDVRMSKLVGKAIYNENNQKVGSVDDVIASRSGQLQVIVATNQKKVAVPWDKVLFGDAKLNSDNTVLMPTATQKSLNSMPTFYYVNQNH